MIEKCIECGQEFERPDKGSKRIYCSRKCAQRNWKKNNPERCEERKIRNRDYMRAYHRTPEAMVKHQKWLQDNPLKKKQ